MRESICSCFFAMCLATACGHYGKPTPGRSQQSLLGTEAFIYFRSNATGWGVDDTTRLQPTEDPQVLELIYEVTTPWILADGDGAVFIETDQLNGWGTDPTAYGPQGGHEVTVPGADSLEPNTWYFRVRYPEAGSYRVVVDVREGSFRLESAAGADVTEWPNELSRATSDPWLGENHDTVATLRPRVLALNFVNTKSNAQMLADYDNLTAAFREASRPRGHVDPDAAPMLEYEVAYAIDLRDPVPPEGWPYNNSTKFPRENPTDGYWSFDYEQLFTQQFADLMGIEDPENPGHNLTLCELSSRGLVHEVWMYGDADVPDVAAAEVLGIMPPYDEAFRRIPGAPMDRCAGNGCFDEEDAIPADCTRTLRIGFVNNTRGAGCYLESLSHGIESVSSRAIVPYFSRYFTEFAGFDLHTRYGLPFSSWYAIDMNDPAQTITFTGPASIEYNVAGSGGTIDPYVPVCGNVHFPPNGRRHYDQSNVQSVEWSCDGYRTAGGPGAGDPTTLVSSAEWSDNDLVAPDCMGAWLVHWWQHLPGPGTAARDASGQPMRSWLPFLFY